MMNDAGQGHGDGGPDRDPHEDGKSDEALALHLSEGYPLYRDMTSLVTRAVRAEEAEMGRLRDGGAAASRRGYLLMGGFAAASIVPALALGFVISWSFILPVRRAEGFLDQVAKGDFTARGARARKTWPGST